MDFGCFVELMGFQKKAEGLVHLSNISATKRAGSAKDMVGKGEFRLLLLKRTWTGWYGAGQGLGC
jgi:hypothetical protein